MDGTGMGDAGMDDVGMDDVGILGVRHAQPPPPLPRGACGCHTHVFGPAAAFPFDPGRTYTPGDATADALRWDAFAAGPATRPRCKPSWLTTPPGSMTS